MPVVAALLLFVLLSPALAAADRGDAFPGYKEEAAPAECKNQLPDEYCEARAGGSACSLHVLACTVGAAL